MKILVLGKNGQLGRSIYKLLNTECFKSLYSGFTFADRNTLDLRNIDAIEEYFTNKHFDVILNCSAYTRVDDAEEHTQEANLINHLAVKKLAEIANRNKNYLLHISTDYVFDGRNSNPYIEIDKTNPINVYGVTKLDGEKAIKKIMKNNAIIIRTSWLYSEFGNNFVKTIIKLAKNSDQLKIINDQIGSPTYASDLAESILFVIKKIESEKKDILTQIYHYSNDGDISWYDFAIEILKLSQITCKILPIETRHFITAAKRPINSTMSKSKIHRDFGIQIKSWKNSLIEALVAIKLQKNVNTN